MSTSSVSGNGSSNATVTPLTFNGQSKFSSDFQTIIDKYVSASSIQLNQLQSQQTADQNQLTAVQSLDSAFTNLEDAINQLTTAVGSQSFTGSVSNSSQASVAVGNGAFDGTYSLEIDTLGAITQTVSTAGQTVTDPTKGNISSATSFSLSVNGKTTTITPTINTLSGLASAINAAGAGVAASVVNAGSSGSPDYRLSIQSTDLSNDTIQLTDSSNTQYLTTIASGSPATYKVDGLPAQLSSNSSTITLAPGVTVNLLAQTPTNSPVIVTVQQTSTATGSALANFASAYDQIQSLLNSQHGVNAGALSGSSILMTAQRVMQSIGTYSDGNGNGLNNIGLDLDAAGNFSFNASEFAANFGNNMQALSNFLGDTTQGFIGSTSNLIASLNDPYSGILTSEESTLNATISKLNSSITEQVTMINQNQQNLFTQLANSDATIFSLTTQVTYFQDLFFPNANASTTTG